MIRLESNTLHNLCRCYAAGARWYACGVNGEGASAHDTREGAEAELAAEGITLRGGARIAGIADEILVRLFGTSKPTPDTTVCPEFADESADLTASSLVVIWSLVFCELLYGDNIV